ncbi:MAG: YdeI/OmpD-associated family protein, partial [Actinomycetes bacterium]
MAAELPELLLPDAREWRAWLEENHASSSGVWLVLHKKGGTVTALTYAAALDEALCFGWIDGQTRKRDGESSFQRFTPRSPRSIWSLRNVGHVERAKSDGRWERAYAGSASAVVPDDLAAAIAANPDAQAMFEVLSAQNRYALIFRLGQLKTEAGR